MATMTRTYDPSLDLTIYALHGEVTGREIIDQINEDCEINPPRHIIWDFTDADMHLLTQDRINAILTAGKKLADVRSGGLTAIVVPEDLSYGLGRMYETFTEINKFKTRNRSFRSLEQAREWLLTGDG